MLNAELPRKLGLIDATAIVVGTVIGSAIFLVPNTVARNLPSVPMIFLVWSVTGLLSFFGALAYAELGAMMPDTGGQYVYLREAYGPLGGFLSGWASFLVMQSGAIATLAAGFSIYLSYFIPLSPLAAKMASVALIAVLTIVNYRGVRLGAAVQRTFTFLKLAGLAIIVISAFLVPRHVEAGPAAVPGEFSWAHFGVAMIACLWAYEGWNCVSFVAGEVKRPERNLLLALLRMAPGEVNAPYCVVPTVVFQPRNVTWLSALEASNRRSALRRSPSRMTRPSEALRPNVVGPVMVFRAAVPNKPGAGLANAARLKGSPAGAA